MLIRSLKPEDICTLAEIISTLALWQRYGVGKERALSIIGDSLESTGHGDAEWFVCEVDGAVCGFVYILHKGLFGISGYIKMIGVAQGHQGKGAGKALLSAAEETIFSRGPNVFLLVSDFNEPAIRFYEASGYSLVGRLKDYVLPGVDELLYRKTLGPTSTTFGRR